jgi:hypothetical protein
MDVEMYVRIPPGFPHYGDTNKCYRVVKAVYGTKQAGRLFWLDITKFMLEELKMKFKQSTEDPCVFYRLTSTQRYFIIGIYVDDNIVVIHPDDINEFNDFFNQICKKYTITELHDAHWILGIKIDYDNVNGIMKLTQQAYVEKVLEKFNMNNCKSAATPAIKHRKSDAENTIQLMRNEDENDHEGGASDEANISYPYMNAVGALIYLAYTTRPDILYAVNRVAQKTQQPNNEDVMRVKRIFRYLAGTRGLGLVYRRCSSDSQRGNASDVDVMSIKVYVDAAWDVYPDSKSQSGYVIMVGGCNVYSNSCKQGITSQSSCESELVAMVDGSNEAIGIRYLVMELYNLKSYEINRINIYVFLFTDSQSGIDICKKEKLSLPRHMNRRYNIIRERVLNNDVIINYISTKNQIADILTKPLDAAQHQHLAVKLLDFGFKRDEE